MYHISVLRDELVKSLNFENNRNIIVDATIGLGWHAWEVIKKMKKWDIFIGIDRDSENLLKAEKQIRTEILSGKWEFPTCIFIHSSFARLKEILSENQIHTITGIIYDLWVSSVHFDEWERGFSFRSDGPLDMRFDRMSWEKTASELIAYTPERELFEIFRKYGEEPKAFFIAQAIASQRKQKPINTTQELAAIIEWASFDPKSTLRVFQAIRIALNQEFDHIIQSLEQAIELLESNGTIGVISFHSLEDRLIKQTFARFEKGTIDEITGQTTIPALLKKINKKPILPSEDEIHTNPRSRSAKLRIVSKQSIH